jgi:hypothetical protein
LTQSSIGWSTWGFHGLLWIVFFSFFSRTCYALKYGTSRDFNGWIVNGPWRSYPICSMVLEYLPTFARTKSPNVGKYTIHGAYGYLKTLEGRHRVGVEKPVSEWGTRARALYIAWYCCLARVVVPGFQGARGNVVPSYL